MPQDDFFEFGLSQRFEVVYQDRDPDVVIFSVFGPPPRRSEYANHPLFIAYSGEPAEIQSDADLYLDFHPDRGENHFRLPLWALYIQWDLPRLARPYRLAGLAEAGQGSHHAIERTARLRTPSGPSPLLLSQIPEGHTSLQPKTTFCNFTYRNPQARRIEIFHKLDAYRRVESTGPLLNNMGYRMISKSRVLGAYKLTIAFENTLAPGYVTERLLEPLSGGSVPIHHGGAMASEDFNGGAFIDASRFRDYDELVDHVIAVDQDMGRHSAYLSQPVFKQMPNDPEPLPEVIHARLAEKNKDMS